MKLLSLDSSTPVLSAALLNENQLAAETEQHQPPGTPNPLLSMIDGILTSTGVTLADLDGFVLTHGPGSFTGLRVGLSLIKGFVLAMEKPVMGISSLEAWARALGEKQEPVCSLLDARKGEVYYALFQNSPRGLERVGKEEVIPPGEVSSRIHQPARFTGTGVERYRNLLQDTLGDRFLESGHDKAHTTAGAAVLAARHRFKSESTPDLRNVTLRYLRKPEAEVHYKAEPGALH
ncbi:MAG: tRNA (adenosine(37)-N6)-threonylcarbamoyltransferase complex dimerization subunit type 1 TsaB [Nitrospina sp.]|nr:tRNA (adenosine(37)-N6)-threonylcarbamoyltransferase complex dimerization subunit type 1 TsaB [Nitrospina sp.]